MFMCSYDAWGKLLTVAGSEQSGIGTLNPLTYRGYVYDYETGLYYLQSRYYDPEVGRFINSDILVSTGQGLLGNNMFAYCRNNPVSRKDAYGTDDISVEDCNDDDKPQNDAGVIYRPGGGSAGGPPTNGGISPIKGAPTNGKVKADLPDNKGYSYTPTSGGGGVTSSVTVGETTVTFKYGGRHMEFSDISGIERAIAEDVVTRPQTLGYRGEYDLFYNGMWFTYRYWTVDVTHINVGTYFYKICM